MTPGTFDFAQWYAAQPEYHWRERAYYGPREVWTAAVEWEHPSTQELARMPLSGDWAPLIAAGNATGK